MTHHVTEKSCFFRVNRCYIWNSFSVVENIKATIVHFHKTHISCIMMMFCIFVSTLGLRKHFLCEGVIRTLLTWLAKLLHVQPGMRGEKVGYPVLFFFIYTPAASQLHCRSLQLSVGVKRTSRLLASLGRVLSFRRLGGRGGGATEQGPKRAFQKCKSRCRYCHSTSSRVLCSFSISIFPGVVFPEVDPTFNIHPLFT